ncbi:MAG: hypothetical protein ACPGXY_03925 [Alphaproteobacteria bacterium]
MINKRNHCIVFEDQEFFLFEKGKTAHESFATIEALLEKLRALGPSTINVIINTSSIEVQHEASVSMSWIDRTSYLRQLRHAKQESYAIYKVQPYDFLGFHSLGLQNASPEMKWLETLHQAGQQVGKICLMPLMERMLVPAAGWVVRATKQLSGAVRHTVFHDRKVLMSRYLPADSQDNIEDTTRYLKSQSYFDGREIIQESGLVDFAKLKLTDSVTIRSLAPSRVPLMTAAATLVMAAWLGGYLKGEFSDYQHALSDLQNLHSDVDAVQARLSSAEASLSDADYQFMKQASHFRKELDSTRSPLAVLKSISAAMLHRGFLIESFAWEPQSLRLTLKWSKGHSNPKAVVDSFNGFVESLKRQIPDYTVNVLEAPFSEEILVARVSESSVDYGQNSCKSCIELKVVS